MEDQSQPPQEGFFQKMMHRFGGARNIEPAAKVIQNPVVDENKFTPANATTEMKVVGPGLNFGKASTPDEGKTITVSMPEAAPTPITITPVENKPAA